MKMIKIPTSFFLPYPNIENHTFEISVPQQSTFGDYVKTLSSQRITDEKIEFELLGSTITEVPDFKGNVSEEIGRCMIKPQSAVGFVIKKSLNEELLKQMESRFLRLSVDCDREIERRDGKFKEDLQVARNEASKMKDKIEHQRKKLKKTKRKNEELESELLVRDTYDHVKRDKLRKKMRERIREFKSKKKEFEEVLEGKEKDHELVVFELGELKEKNEEQDIIIKQQEEEIQSLKQQNETFSERLSGLEKILKGL